MLGEICISSSSTDKTALQVWDIRSGAILSSLRASTATSSSLSVLPFTGSIQPALVFAAQAESPLIQVFTLGKEQSITRHIVPEKMEALACDLILNMLNIIGSEDGVHLVGGGISGRVYLWNVASGHLLKMFDAHLGTVRSVVFTKDCSMVATSGDDAMVHVWDIQANFQSATPKPYRSLSSHRLPVTGLSTSYTPSQSSRIYSCSLDRTVKIWDLHSAKLLITLVFSAPLYCLAVDPMESILICGGGNGEIFRVDLQTSGHVTGNIYERADSNGNVDVFGSSATDKNGEQKKERIVMVGHSKRVNALSLNFDATMLVSGSDDETCIVWDCKSRQALRSFTQHKGVVTSVSIMLKPTHLSDVDFLKAKLPVYSAFQRYQTTDESAFSVVGSEACDLPECFSSMNAAVDSSEVLKGKVNTLESKNKALAGFNDALYNASVDCYLKKKN